MSNIKTPNEAVASIKTREDAVSAISTLYGLFETTTGRAFLIDLLEQHQSELLDWLPDNVVIELAKEHMREEWKGYPWN